MSRRYSKPTGAETLRRDGQKGDPRVRKLACYEMEGLMLALLNAGPFLWSVGATGAEDLGVAFPDILTAADGP